MTFNPFDVLGQFQNPFQDQLNTIKKQADDIKSSRFYEVLYPYFKVTPMLLFRRLSLLVFPFAMWPKRSAGLDLDLYIPLWSLWVISLRRGVESVLETGHFVVLYSVRKAVLCCLSYAIAVFLLYFLFKSSHMQIELLQVISVVGYSLFCGVFRVPYIKYYFIACAATHTMLQGAQLVKAAKEQGMASARQVGVWNWFVVLAAVLSAALSYLCIL